jgi:hypothetical protein
MQRVSTNLQTTVLSGLGLVAGERSYDWLDLYEFFLPSYVPGDQPDGSAWDNAEAVARYSSETFTYNGQTYQRQVGKRSDVSRYMSASANGVTVTFSNIDRNLATFDATHQLEGMRLVVRCVSRSHPAYGSIILFNGRVDKQADIDEETCTVSAKQDFGNTEQEIPSHSYQADDEQGRDVTDPLFEGFRFTPTAGVNYYDTVERAGGLGGLLGRHKAVTHTQAWSSFLGTPMGDPIPEVLGRTQLPGVPIVWADKGTFIAFLMAYCRGRIEALSNIKVQTKGYSEVYNLPGPIGPVIHLGDPGGTGTNTGSTNQFQESGKFSRLAYIEGAVDGSTIAQEDPAPLVTSLIQGRRVPLPDESGDFTEEGWTDNPAYNTRFLLTDPDFIGLGDGWIDDAACVDTAAWCDAPINDDSNGELAYVPNGNLPDSTTGEPRAGIDFHRLRSTGRIDPLYYRYHFLGLDPLEPPELADNEYNGFDVDSPPETIAPVRFIRKRYTVNCALTSRTKAIDFLYSTILPAFKGYLVIGANGKVQIRSERPADNAFVRGSHLAGVLSIAVNDVTPWRASLLDMVVIGWGLVTSDVRRVTAAVYDAAAGGAVTLSASATGALTATSSGAGLSGGSTSVPASGTVTIGGTPTNGLEATITLDGVAIVHTLTAHDTTGTVAAMLASRINADPTLKKYLTANWDTTSPTVVTIQSRQGTLTLGPVESGGATATANAHAAGEEIIRIQHVFDASSIFPKSFKSPLSSKSSAINTIVIKYNDAKNDFAETTLTVIDPDHIAQVGKRNKLEVNGGAIDSHAQASLIANFLLSKHREGNPQAMWSTDPRALLAEEGDLAAVTDDSRGLINYVLRLEEVKISEIHSVALLGRQYSSIMFSDTPGSHTVPLPTNLSLSHAPPVATNLTYVEESGFFLADGTWIPKVTYTFDFGGFVGVQFARIYLKRPGETDYTEYDQVTPDESNVGRFDLYPLESGIHWVKVVTESSNGLSNSTGNPEDEFTVDGNLMPRPLPPSNLTLTTETTGTYLIGRFDASTSLGVIGYIAYKVVSGSEVFVWEGDALQFRDLAPQTGSITYHVYAKNKRWPSLTYASGVYLSLRLPAPTVTGTRVANGSGSDLIVMWTPGIEPELTDLIEKYVLRIRKVSDNSIVKEQIIDLPDFVPCVWTFVSEVGGSHSTNVVTSADGTIISSGTGTYAYVSQQFYGDMEIVWEVDSRDSPEIGVVASPPRTPEPGTGVYVSSYLGTVGAESASTFFRQLPPKSRLTIDIKNGHAEYYINNIFWFRSYQAQLPNGLKVSVFCATPGQRAGLRVRVRPYVPRQFLYTLDMQKSDNSGSGFAVGTITVEVAQISARDVEGLSSTPLTV